MRIIYYVDSSERPQLDGYEPFKDQVTAFDVEAISEAGRADEVLGLATLLRAGCGWGTVEFVNMRLWIHVLNALDDVLRAATQAHGVSLLGEGVAAAAAAAAADLVDSVLAWSADILMRAVHKDVYNSMDRVLVFFRAAGGPDHVLYRRALDVAYALALPPPNHRTVFVYDLCSVLEKEPAFSEPLFDLVKCSAGLAPLRAAQAPWAGPAMRRKSMLFQAAFVLLVCHPSSKRVRAFFANKSWVLTEAVEALTACLATTALDTSNPPSSSSSAAAAAAAAAAASGTTGTIGVGEGSEESWALRRTACACLIAILDRATEPGEDTDDEDLRRRGRKAPKKPQQMPAFAAVQRLLGLERGQMGGLLVQLVRQELHWLHSTGAGQTAHPVGAAALERMLWVEELLSLTIKAAPLLRGALTTVLDNGLLSVLQAIATPKRRVGAGTGAGAAAAPAVSPVDPPDDTPDEFVCPISLCVMQVRRGGSTPYCQCLGANPVTHLTSLMRPRGDRCRWWLRTGAPTSAPRWRTGSPSAGAITTS